MGFSNSAERTKKPLISVVIPAYNEELSIEQCYLRVSQVFDQLKSFYLELVLVNDGSTDRTQQLIHNL